MPSKRRRQIPKLGDQPATADRKRAKIVSSTETSLTQGRDIVFCLKGNPEEDLLLNRDELMRKCEYFAKFDRHEWPKRFVLQAHSDPALCTVIPEIERCSEDAQVIREDTVTRYARELNQTLFGLLSRKELLNNLSIDHPSYARLLCDTATLSISYGCTEGVKDRILIAARSWGGGGEKLVRQQPFLLLETAYTLEDEALFRDALKHAAGQQAALLAHATELPQDLKTIVDEHVRTVSEAVRKSLQRLSLATTKVVDFPGFLAWAIFHQHLLTRVLPTSPAGKDRFAELYYLFNLRTGLDLLGSPHAARLLRSVDVVDIGLVQARNALEYLSDDAQEEAKQELCDLDAAFDEKLNVKSVKANLQLIVEHARKVLASLFSGDKNVDYFTFLDLAGELPRKRK